jgi:transposase
LAKGSGDRVESGLGEGSWPPRKPSRDYRDRHRVECFMNKIKGYRRIFSRFDKLASRYLGFLSLAATLI